MGICDRIFGRWQVVRSVPVEVGKVSALLKARWSEAGVLHYERHTRTDETRTVLETTSGRRVLSNAMAGVLLGRRQ